MSTQKIFNLVTGTIAAGALSMSVMTKGELDASHGTDSVFANIYLSAAKPDWATSPTAPDLCDLSANCHYEYTINYSNGERRLRTHALD